MTRPALAPIPRNYPEDGYIRRLPQDPRGRSTVCAIRGVTASWTCFLGPDGIADTDDDIGNWVADADAP